MRTLVFQAGGLLALLAVASVGSVPARASDSSAFDKACQAYYATGTDPNVPKDGDGPRKHCACLSDYYVDMGGVGALDFLARTYIEDPKRYVDQYPQGKEWLELSEDADFDCEEE